MQFANGAMNNYKQFLQISITLMYLILALMMDLHHNLWDLVYLIKGFII